MKDYLVTEGSQYYIVLAKDAKDAICQVWEKYYVLQNLHSEVENKELGYPAYHIYKKTELSAKSLGSLHNKEGRVIKLW